jgi:hypothetical protein
VLVVVGTFPFEGPAGLPSEIAAQPEQANASKQHRQQQQQQQHQHQQQQPAPGFPPTQRALESGSSASAFKELPVRCQFYACETDKQRGTAHPEHPERGSGLRTGGGPTSRSKEQEIDIGGRGEMRRW